MTGADVIILSAPPGSCKGTQAGLPERDFGPVQTGPDVTRGVVLDGFPRTEGQAATLHGLLASRDNRVTAAISPDVDEAAMVARVAGRSTCAGCGKGFHNDFKRPAVAGACDRCGGTAFKRRADDTAGTVRERLHACHAQTAPLISHHDRQGVPERIDAMGTIAGIRRALAVITEGIAA